MGSAICTTMSQYYHIYQCTIKMTTTDPGLSVCQMWPKYIQYVLLYNSPNHGVHEPRLPMCHRWPRCIWSVLGDQSCNHDIHEPNLSL